MINVSLPSRGLSEDYWAGYHDGAQIERSKLAQELEALQREIDHLRAQIANQ